LAVGVLNWSIKKSIPNVSLIGTFVFHARERP
jgi:hypothetical protein